MGCQQPPLDTAGVCRLWSSREISDLNRVLSQDREPLERSSPILEHLVIYLQFRSMTMLAVTDPGSQAVIILVYILAIADHLS